MGRLGLVAIGGMVLAPLVTWLPIVTAKVPTLGLPQYPPARGVDLWQLQAFWLVALLAVASLVLAEDRWLGAAVAVAGLTIFLRGAALDPTASVLFALGALLLVGIRRLPVAWRALAKRAVLALAWLQCGYAILQAVDLDLIWGLGVMWLYGAPFVSDPRMYGLLGSVNATAGYVAVVAPLMPAPLLLAAIVMVVWSHSLGAVLALLVGILVRIRAGLLVWGLGAIAALWSATVLVKTTQGARVTIWGFVASHWPWASAILGTGLGGWAARVPALQIRERFAPTGELWAEAHNDWLQWAFETGLVGMVLLVGWLWTHRAMVRDPVWGGSIAALATQALTWHPFHIVSSALLGLVLIGLATPAKGDSTPCVV